MRVAAWQRGLAQKGLTAGRFYHIYSRSAATPISDPQVRARYEAMRDTGPRSPFLLGEGLYRDQYAYSADPCWPSLSDCGRLGTLGNTT